MQGKTPVELSDPFVRKCPGPIVWNKGKAKRDGDLAADMAATIRPYRNKSTTVFKYMKSLYEILDICDAPPGADLKGTSSENHSSVVHLLMYYRTRGGYSPFSIKADIISSASENIDKINNTTAAQQPNCSVTVKCVSGKFFPTLTEYVTKHEGSVVIVPFYIYTNGKKGHANLLIFVRNEERVQVWRIDPWGFEHNYGDWCLALERQVAAFVLSLSTDRHFFWYNSRNPRTIMLHHQARITCNCLINGIESFYRYTAGNDDHMKNGKCKDPIWQNLEKDHTYHDALDPRGYCNTWCFLIADLVLRHYNLEKIKSRPQTADFFCSWFGHAVGPITLIKSPAVLNKIMVDYAFSRSLQSVVLFKDFPDELVESTRSVVYNHYVENVPYTSRDAIISKHLDSQFTRNELAMLKQNINNSLNQERDRKKKSFFAWVQQPFMTKKRKRNNS
jgi:hypothetical protein